MRHLWPTKERSDRVCVVGQAMRRRRTSYVPTQSGRTGPTTAETSKLVNLVRNLSGSPPKSGILSTEINGILYSEISGILWGEISIIQCCWSGDAPEAHKLRPDSVGTDKSQQRHEFNNGMTLRTQTPAQTDSFDQQRREKAILFLFW